MGIPTKHSDSYVGQLETRIAELEADNQRLRAALEPFAEYYNRREYLCGIHDDYYRVVDIKVKTLRAAAKAMEESE